jgi:hypothetical protein
MTDISFKLRAEALGKSIENMAPKVEAEINEAVKNLAHAAYTQMTALIQRKKMADTNRQDYLKGLKFTELGDNSYLIHLEGEWANKLENGTGPYSLREVLLKSKKIVQVGPRTGQPWVQHNQQGKKYAHVPFDHHPHRGSGSGDLSTDIKRLTAKNVQGKAQNLTEIFKSVEGKALDSGSGKATKPVAVVKELPDGASKNLMNMAKFQKVHESGAVTSIYMTWRTVSESGKDWTHPGLPGLDIFKHAEEWVKQEMDQLVKTILK